MSRDMPKDPSGKPMWYGRRRTHKLRPGRQRLVDDLLPQLLISPPDDGAPVTFEAGFGPPARELVLEIGFGAGEHLSGEAAAHPDTDFIGCEPFINGVAALLADVEAQGLKNVRVFDDDVRLLLTCLPENSVSTIYMLYPDPWPKARHKRRRIFQYETLDMLARIARDGALLQFASDHMDYAAWALAEARRHPDWVWTARTPADWRAPPAGWVPTRYEAKAKRKGDTPAYLAFRRQPRR